MKKIIALWVSIALMCLLVACNSDSQSKTEPSNSWDTVMFNMEKTVIERGDNFIISDLSKERKITWNGESVEAEIGLYKGISLGDGIEEVLKALGIEEGDGICNYKEGDKEKEVAFSSLTELPLETVSDLSITLGIEADGKNCDVMDAEELLASDVDSEERIILYNLKFSKESDQFVLKLVDILGL